MCLFNAGTGEGLHNEHLYMLDLTCNFDPV